jgi:hypothetical protein
MEYTPPAFVVVDLPAFAPSTTRTVAPLIAAPVVEVTVPLSVKVDGVGVGVGVGAGAVGVDEPQADAHTQSERIASKRFMSDSF